MGIINVECVCNKCNSEIKSNLRGSFIRKFVCMPCYDFQERRIESLYVELEKLREKLSKSLKKSLPKEKPSV